MYLIKGCKIFPSSRYDICKKMCTQYILNYFSSIFLKDGTYIYENVIRDYVAFRKSRTILYCCKENKVCTFLFSFFFMSILFMFWYINVRQPEAFGGLATYLIVKENFHSGNRPGSKYLILL